MCSNPASVAPIPACPSVPVPYRLDDGKEPTTAKNFPLLLLMGHPNKRAVFLVG